MSKLSFVILVFLMTFFSDYRSNYENSHLHPLTKWEKFIRKKMQKNFQISVKLDIFFLATFAKTDNPQ